MKTFLNQVKNKFKLTILPVNEISVFGDELDYP